MMNISRNLFIAIIMMGLSGCSHIVTEFKCKSSEGLPGHLAHADEKLCTTAPKFSKCFGEDVKVDPDLFYDSSKASIFFNYYVQENGELKDLIITSERKLSLDKPLDQCLRQIAGNIDFKSNPYYEPYEITFEYRLKKDYFGKK